MSLAESIFSALSNDAAVVALVGDRIFPNYAKTPATPYVIFQRISSDPAPTHGEPVGIQHDLVQVACFANTYAEALSLRDACVAALDGELLAGGENPTLQDERESYEEAVDLHRCDADFLI